MKKIISKIVLVSLAMSPLIAQEEVNKAESAPKEKKADESKLELKARVQARVVSGQANSGFAETSNFDSADFNFRRIRLGMKYEPAPWTGSVLDVKLENLVTTKTGGIEKLGGIQEANIWFKPGLLNSVITLGQFKIPFLRDQLTSSGNLVSLERSLSEELLPQNDIGFMLELQPLAPVGSEWTNRLDLAVALTNGNGSMTDGIGIKKGENVSGTTYMKLLNWRVQINPFGGPVLKGKESAWKMGSEIFHEGNLPAWSIAAGGAHTQDSESGLFKSGSLDGYTFDTSFYWHGIYLSGEYTLATGGAVPSGDYTMAQGTLGYNLKLGSVYLMPLVRYDFAQYDSSGDGTIGDAEKESKIWIGANLFAMKHDLKFQIYYCLVNDGTGSALDEDVLYFQVTSNIGKKL